MKMFAQGLAAAGVNPTRASFASSLQTLGRFDNAGFGPSSFRGDKLGAGESVRLVQAAADCNCWRPIGDFVATGFSGS